MKASMAKILSAFAIVCLLLPALSMARAPEGSLLDGVKPGPDGKIDVLTVFAHPDDESIYGGGALIKIKKDPRVRLHILCMGVGDWPEQSADLGIESSQLVKIRSAELRNAAAILGADDVTQWDFLDRSFSSRDPEKLTRDVLDKIEEVGAEIVITHDPAGITRNPDHLTCSRVATEAFKRSSAQRLYYPTLPNNLYKVAMAFMKDEWEGQPVEPAKPTFTVNIRAEKDMKRMACYAHASQMFYSEIGSPAKLLLLFPREYWALGATNE